LKKIDNSNKLDRKYLARFEKNNVRMIKKQDGTTIPLSLLGQDPFWPAFFEGLEKTDI
jgi:hypothetical protein